jgi:ADP-heptose:LPS heptosyltransferase
MKHKRIIISRTDSIGDVVLTLPMAGWLKQHFPGVQIIFLGSEYTKEVVEACAHVDEFVPVGQLDSWTVGQLAVGSQHLGVKENIISEADLIVHVFPRKEIARWAKRTGIPVRLGTAHRLYHWYSCNKLEFFTRKRSDLHESQLNFKLLRGLTGKPVPSLSEIEKLFGLVNLKPLEGTLSALLEKDRFNLILHPKSKGSAREWGLDNFSSLAGIIPQEKFKVFITGTREEGNILRDSGFFEDTQVTDLTGKMPLSQLISFINAADGLIAGSTGPLHLAAALGKYTIGLYPPIRPMHPGRWAPVGKNASFIVLDKNCSKCRKNGLCECIRQITPEQVLEKLMQNL